eukprot:GHVT01103152.1.p1 GENE.GHVT01103152.1~~GHVT01103152.1.p1  ORF type:complete len:106 (-),score=15.62 GHVT01103152.1:562-879(-)
MLLQQFYKRCCSSPPSALEGSATPAVAAAALAASGGPAGGLTAEMIKAVLNVVRARGASQCITLAVSIIAFLNRLAHSAINALQTNLINPQTSHIHMHTNMYPCT